MRVLALGVLFACGGVATVEWEGLDVPVGDGVVKEQDADHIYVAYAAGKTTVPGQLDGWGAAVKARGWTEVDRQRMGPMYVHGFDHETTPGDLRLLVSGAGDKVDVQLVFRR